MLDRYQFGQELGAGARGVVYRGRDTLTGRVVAIKLMCEDSTNADDFDGADVGCARGCQSTVSHPNIVRTYETAQVGHVRYVVMELAEGADLRTHTRPSDLLPLATTLSIMARVADALHHGHREDVVHGDLKPANILFDPKTQRVKVTDFPLIRGAGGAAMMALAGTPAYAAPEQLCGLDATGASDQFSLGVTLYQLACGHLPFGGCSRPEIARRTVNEAHTDIRSHDAALPEALAALLDRALAKNARARYPNSQHLARALWELDSARPSACDRAHAAQRSEIPIGAG